jgi:hypothetical protein
MKEHQTMHMYVKKCINNIKQIITNIKCIIRRPLPSFGLGGAAPGITAGVQLWPARTTRPASAHLSGPSKLPGHVSLRRFETAKLPGHVSFASRLWPGKASLLHSSLPRCLVMYL